MPKRVREVIAWQACSNATGDPSTGASPLPTLESSSNASTLLLMSNVMSNGLLVSPLPAFEQSLTLECSGATRGESCGPSRI